MKTKEVYWKHKAFLASYISCVKINGIGFYDWLMELVLLFYCHTLYMGKWVDHILISMKSYDCFVVELAVLSRIYELKIGFGKNDFVLAKCLNSHTFWCITVHQNYLIWV